MRTVCDDQPLVDRGDMNYLEWDVIPGKRQRFEDRDRSLTERENALADRELAITRRETEFALQRPAVFTANATSTRPFSLRDISDILPEFDPDSAASVDCPQFVDRVTRLLNAFGMLVLAAQSKLRGNAKIWADTQTTVHHRWAEFSEPNTML